jgi:hypothetical protein
MLEESGITKDIEIKVTKDGLKIKPINSKQKNISNNLILSQKVLSRDWDKLEEDEAWADL